MAESSKHTALVHIIIDHIQRSFADNPALAILNDLSSALHAEKPSRIGGFVPDVYAFDAPLTTVIIGEAKTADDLETEHSQRQLIAFLSFLGQQKAGIFILAVPWHAKRRAQALVTALCQATGAGAVSVVTLDDLSI